MYKPTDLLDQLSQAAREQAIEEKNRLDSRWDRLAAGRLSPEEHDELLGEADVSGEAYEAYQAFKPLGPAFEKQVAAAILARQQAEAEERLAAADEAAPALPVPVPAMSPPPARKAWYLGGLGSVVMAAMAAVLLYPVAPLSSYAPKKLAGIPEDRGSVAAEVVGGDTPVYYSGNVIELVAETRRKPAGKLDARLLYVGEDGRLQRSDLGPEIEQKGGLVAFSPIVGDDLELSPGTWKLVMVIARKGKFPGDRTILEAVESDGQHAKYWQILVWQIKIGSLETS
jgi:hypothetical protein